MGSTALGGRWVSANCRMTTFKPLLKPSGNRWAASLAGALLALGLAGCTGVRTPLEKQARQQLETTPLRPATNNLALTELGAAPDLATVLKVAAANQPSVAAAYYDWLAAVERITQARSFPDPRVGFQMDVNNMIESIMPGLMFDLPGQGKLRAQADVAAAEAEAKRQTFLAAIVQAAYEVEQPLVQLRLVDEKIAVGKRSLGLLAEVEQAAQAQNIAGSATLQDVLRSQMEQDRLRAEIASLEDTRRPLLAQYKAALGLGLATIDPPLPTAFTLPGTVVEEPQLLASMARNPRFKALEAEVRQAEAAIRLAQKNVNPDYTVGLEADLKAQPVMWRPQAGMTLPIWRDKLAAQIAEAQAGKGAAQARLAGEQIRLAVEFAATWFNWREARRSLELNRDQLRPKARQAWEAARAGYASGQTGFLDLIDAERTLLAIEWAEAEARAQSDLSLLDMSQLMNGKAPGAATPMPGGSGGMPAGSAPAGGKAKKM